MWVIELLGFKTYAKPDNPIFRLFGYWVSKPAPKPKTTVTYAKPISIISFEVKPDYLT